METSYGSEVTTAGKGNSMQDVGRDARVVLCGSMTALPVIEQIRDQLVAYGIEALSPQPDDSYGPERGLSAVVEAKRRASLRHISWIKDGRTRAILVVNIDRDGHHDYIGPNAFAEIAIAFAEGREVYLLQGMPTPYAEELTAWGVHCLHGNVERLRHRWSEPRSRRRPSVGIVAGQMKLTEM